MLFKGSGELSGTSMMAKPLLTSASPMAGASAGVSPRKMAIKGSWARACARV